MPLAKYQDNLTDKGIPAETAECVNPLPDSRISEANLEQFLQFGFLVDPFELLALVDLHIPFIRVKVTVTRHLCLSDIKTVIYNSELLY